MRTKRIITFALTLAMLLGIVPSFSAPSMTAYAAETAQTAEEIEASSVSAGLVVETSYSDSFIERLHDKFDSPEIRYWPEQRWWLASGFHTDETLLKNIQEIYDSGFGAAEFIARGTVSNADAPGGTGAARYHWGSDEWSSDSQLIIKRATELGMGFSITSGTNWGTANLPNTYFWPGEPGDAQYSQNSIASLQELSYTTVNVAAGASFSASLPKPVIANRDFYFQGVVAAKVITPRTGAGGGAQNSGQGSNTGVLDAGSLIDLTSQAVETAGDYTLNWTAPAGSDGYVLLTYWMNGAAHTATPSVATNYTINYVDSYGAAALIDYWEEHILTPDLRADIMANGRGEIYMDSLEFSTAASSATNWAGGLHWGHDFLEEFETRRGYDLTLYLPFVTKNTTRPGGNNPLIYDYEVDATDTANNTIVRKVRNDVLQTLTELYQDNVLKQLQEWLHTIGMQLRAEPSYGTTYEISTPAKYLDTVETESFALVNDIDMNRNLSGGAHMYGRLFSSETGAVQGGNYRYGLDYWTYKCFAQFAAGIQRTVFHGYSSHEGPAAIRWPGHEGMNDGISERFNSRLPGHIHYPDWTTMLARNQKMLRQGVPRVDIAILRTDYDFNCYGRRTELFQLHYLNDYNFMMNDMASYWDDDLILQSAGYTYEYFAPMILEDEIVTFDDGLLQSGGPGYQAIILYQEELPLSSALRLEEIAEAGIPVVFVNGATELIKHAGPVYVTHEKAASLSMFKDNTDAQVQEVVNRIKALPNVTEVDDQADTMEELHMLGVYPRAMYAEPNKTILTNTRLDEAEDILYMFTYNYKTYRDVDEHRHFKTDGSYSVEISMDAIGKPYYINTWNGDIGEVAAYEIKDGRTIFTLTLERGEATIIALDLKDDGTGLRATETQADKVILSNGAVSILATSSGTYETKLSDGSTAVNTVTVPAPIGLDVWDLTIEDWNEGPRRTITETKPGAGYTTTEYYFETRKTELNFAGTTLMPWKDLTATPLELESLKLTDYEGVADRDVGMAGVSGLGYYTTSFNLPEGWTENNGAYLNIGSANIYSIAVYVNDQKAPPMDLWTLTTDVSGLLKPGRNDVYIEVSTTLTNRMLSKARWDSNFGTGNTRAVLETPDVQEYGIFDVSIVPYTTDPIIAAMLGIGIEERTAMGGFAEFVISAENLNAVNLIVIDYEVEGSTLTAGADAVGQNGFTRLPGIGRVMEPVGPNLSAGQIYLAYEPQSTVTSDSPMDVAILKLRADSLGDVNVKLTSVSTYGVTVIDPFPDVLTGKRLTAIKPGYDSQSTRITYIADVNGDLRVDNEDLALAIYYYRVDSNSPLWGNAKMADINGDGIIDLIDIVMIYYNFTV